jgi:hypothetical protein
LCDGVEIKVIKSLYAFPLELIKWWRAYCAGSGPGRDAHCTGGGGDGPIDSLLAGRSTRSPSTRAS